MYDCPIQRTYCTRCRAVLRNVKVPSWQQNVELLTSMCIRNKSYFVQSASRIYLCGSSFDPKFVCFSIILLLVGLIQLIFHSHSITRSLPPVTTVIHLLIYASMCLFWHDKCLLAGHRLKLSVTFYLPSRCMTSVSYTHLDVYKRQGLYCKLILSNLHFFIYFVL